MIRETHTCTTSFPSLSPVLCTVTDTLKSSSVPIVDLDNVRSVLVERDERIISTSCDDIAGTKSGKSLLVEGCVAQTMPKTPYWHRSVQNVLQDALSITA